MFQCLTACNLSKGKSGYRHAERDWNNIFVAKKLKINEENASSRTPKKNIFLEIKVYQNTSVVT
jgi:hypothetical protein